MTTKLLRADQVKEAADILRAGGLVGLPTETVYGLGADGLNPAAVRRIFEAKGRPQDNPLILHIPDAAWLPRICEEVSPLALSLAGRFWPGPLTLILKRAGIVPDAVAGGLDTVAVRCPGHEATRAIIEAAGVPVAAPSGNLSGRPSPTSARHMLEDMDGKIEAIVDGGPCPVGVESTILDLTVSPPRLLRPGGLPLEALEAAAGEIAVDASVTRPMREGERPRAPGMKYRHYAPRVPVTVVRGAPDETARYIRAHLGERSGVLCFDEYAGLFPGCAVRLLGPAGDEAAQARHVFDALRGFDHADVTDVWAQSPPARGLGLAVSDRLNKAAAFHLIDLG